MQQGEKDRSLAIREGIQDWVVAVTLVHADMTKASHKRHDMIARE